MQNNVQTKNHIEKIFAKGGAIEALEVEQLEQNVKWASEFSPLSEQQMQELGFKTLPIVRQAIYFRRWDLGA
jgi:hypothetical protein